jgi:alanine racemase
VKTWVEISKQRLTANYNLLARAAGADTTVLAVIKANAYGHGAAVCAPILAQAGAPWLGVTDAAEGELVLEALAGQQPSPKILIMSGFLPEEAKTIIERGLVPVVWHRQQMEWLLAAAREDAPIPIHLEIDTGMGRQGIVPGAELNTLLAWIKSQPQLQLEGVFTHFASAEVAGSPQTSAQRMLFEQAIAAMAHAGLRPAWMHAGNSSTIDTELSEHHLAWLRNLASTVEAKPMVRSGIALYGYCLPIEATPEGLSAISSPPQPTIHSDLLPVMTWKTRIIGLRDLQPGDTVGYNAIFSAPAPMRLALLPIGYADGLRRELSASNTHPGGWAMIHGQRAAIVGRISMNLTTVDVTHIPSVNLGDEVSVLGDRITADDHARLAHTIAYEIVCGIRATSQLVF